MIALLRFTTLRQLRGAKLRTALTVAGLALGVALFVAIRLCNASVNASFRETVVGLSGAASLEVVGGEEGFDESLFETVASTPGVLAAAPIVIRHVALNRHESILVLGVDPFSELTFGRSERSVPLQSGEQWFFDPTAVTITGTLARRHDLHLNQRVTVLDGDRRVPLTVVSILGDSDLNRAWAGSVALMDIANAQWAFERVGRLDRIDIVTEPGQDDAVRSHLRQALPEFVSVQTPARRLNRTEQMVRSFQVNLTALSGISLLVGLFLIYNTMTHALLRRRTEVGLLRALGVERWRLLVLLLIESAALGVSGGVLGVALGWIIAHGALATVTATVHALYGAPTLPQIRLTPDLAAQSLAAGVLVAIGAATLPIREALTTVPREVLHPGSIEQRQWARSWRSVTWALGCWVAAWALTRLDAIDGIPVFGYASAFCLVLGGVFLLPELGSRLSRGIRILAGRLGWVELQLAAGTLGAAPMRTAIAAGALMTALGMMVSVVVMVGSFRQTVAQWIETSFAADLYVNPASRNAVGPRAVFTDSEIADRIASVPGVAAVDRYRRMSIEFRGQQVLLSSRDLTVKHTGERILFRSDRAPDALARMRRGEGIAVTEVLASRFGIRVGDALELPYEHGVVSLPVVGVFYDYATDGGRVLMAHQLMSRYWRDPGIAAVFVYFQPQEAMDSMLAKIDSAVGTSSLTSVITSGDLKKDVLEVFDRTFAITRALDLVAMTVAALGIASTLFALTIERRRELGIMRSLGASRAQISGVILWEGALIGFVGTGLGLVVGFAISLVLIRVVNLQSFGWTIAFAWRVPEVVAAAGVAMGAAVVAGWMPGRQAAAGGFLDTLTDE